MKKFFSLFAAVLFAGSMMATTVVFSGADFTGGTANTGSAFSVTKSGVTVSSDKAYGTGEELRIYQDGTLTVSASENIAKITPEFGQNTKMTFDVATPNATTWSVDASKQIRLSKLTIELGEGGGSGEGEGGGSGEEEGDVLTCAEAAATAATAGDETYKAEGYVTEIAYAWKNGSMSFWMADTKDGGQVLEAFKCAIEKEADAVKVGDKVRVTGKLTMFNTTPEFAAGCTVEILEKGEGGGTDPLPTEIGDVKTCAEAAEALAGVQADVQVNNGADFTLQGYVTEIATAYDSQYGNISFWMADTKDGGKVLEAYRCKPESADKLPEVGDKVEVTGKLKRHGSTPEFDANCTCKIIEKGEGGGSGEEEGDEYTLEELAQIGDELTDITVTFADQEIVDFYASSQQVRKGIFFDIKGVNDKNIELYYSSGSVAVPDTWVVGGKVSGTVTGKWTYYSAKEQWELVPTTANWTWANLTYAAPEGGELTDPTNCAEAREAALSVSEDNEEYNGGKEYTIEGYVTSIQTAFNADYSNVSFWMADTKDGGKVLEAFRAVCATAADAPNEGDKVAVTGKLTKYGTTPEFAAGCTFTILERAEVVPAENLGEKTIEEFLALKNTKDTCVLTGVVKNIKKNDDGTVNKYGNFDLEDETGSVYVYGLLTAAGEAQKFAEMGIEEYDILTIKAVYSEYNGNPQAKNAVFVSVEKGEKPEPQTIELDVVYGEVALYATQGIWQINLYKDYDSETQTVTYPDLYIGVTPKSATTIAGIYSIEEEIAFVEVDVASEQTVTATEATDLEVVCLGDGVYSFYMEFVGDDGNTYVLDAEVPILAYNAESEEGEEIELEDDPETGVETTKVADKAVKFIENATLLIERNGVRYNVMGQVVR